MNKDEIDTLLMAWHLGASLEWRQEPHEPDWTALQDIEQYTWAGESAKALFHQWIETGHCEFRLKPTTES